jgi:hypothetical protein
VNGVCFSLFNFGMVRILPNGPYVKAQGLNMCVSGFFIYFFFPPNTSHHD